MSDLARKLRGNYLLTMAEQNEIADRIEALEADNAALKAELISTQEAWAEVRKGEMEAVTKLMFYEAERDALKADAERYRWLRVHSTGPSEGWSTHVNPESLDAVVDAAISAAKGKGK